MERSISTFREQNAEKGRTLAETVVFVALAAAGIGAVGYAAINGLLSNPNVINSINQAAAGAQMISH